MYGEYWIHGEKIQSPIVQFAETQSYGVGRTTCSSSLAMVRLGPLPAEKLRLAQRPA